MTGPLLCSGLESGGRFRFCSRLRLSRGQKETTNGLSDDAGWTLRQHQCGLAIRKSHHQRRWGYNPDDIQWPRSNPKRRHSHPYLSDGRLMRILRERTCTQAGFYRCTPTRGQMPSNMRPTLDNSINLR